MNPSYWLAQPFFLPSFTEFSWSLSRLLRTHQRWGTFYGSFRSLKPIFTGFLLLVFFYRFFCAKIDFFFSERNKNGHSGCSLTATCGVPCSSFFFFFFFFEVGSGWVGLGWVWCWWRRLLRRRGRGRHCRVLSIKEKRNGISIAVTPPPAPPQHPPTPTPTSPR